jgi:hypothetical protein
MEWFGGVALVHRVVDFSSPYLEIMLYDVFEVRAVLFSFL